MRGALTILVTIFVLAIFSMMDIYSHEAIARPPNYNEITETGGVSGGINE